MLPASASRESGSIIPWWPRDPLQKDYDFVRLLEAEGPPPQVLWITTGNTSNAHLRVLFAQTLDQALSLIRQGESLVEISDAKGTVAG